CCLSFDSSSRITEHRHELPRVRQISTAPLGTPTDRPTRMKKAPFGANSLPLKFAKHRLLPIVTCWPPPIIIDADFSGKLSGLPETIFEPFLQGRFAATGNDSRHHTSPPETAGVIGKAPAVHLA